MENVRRPTVGLRLSVEHASEAPGLAGRKPEVRGPRARARLRTSNDPCLRSRHIGRRRWDPAYRLVVAVARLLAISQRHRSGEGEFGTPFYRLGLTGGDDGPAGERARIGDGPDAVLVSDGFGQKAFDLPERVRPCGTPGSSPRVRHRLPARHRAQPSRTSATRSLCARRPPREEKSRHSSPRCETQSTLASNACSMASAPLGERSRKVPLSIHNRTWVSATTPATDGFYSVLPSNASWRAALMSAISIEGSSSASASTGQR